MTDRLISINHREGRNGHVPDLVVIHVTEGDAHSVRSWFNNPVAEVSAHYMVCRDGAIDRFVAEDDTAWHAGRVDHPTADLVLARPGVNPNAYSIGIEHEGSGTEPLTEPQEAASLALIRSICARWNIPMDRTHIVGHHEIYSLKTCPGAISVDALVKALNPEPFTTAPKVVWSSSIGDWLVVTKVSSDRVWEYVPMSAVRRLGGKQAGTPLSQMPVQP